MGKETGFTFIFDQVDTSNLDLMTSCRNPVIFSEPIKIDERKFHRGICPDIKSFPENTVFDKDGFFIGCDSLESISKSTIFNGDVCFQFCSSLKSISEGVVFNGNAIFFDCPKIESISENVVFNGNIEFTSEYKKVGQPTISKELEKFLTKLNNQGKIAGNLYF
jgi:hypothetical protein